MASNLLQKNTLTRSLTAPYLSSLRFESCLGSGAFGLVLKATNLANGSQTAVKFIFPPATQDGTEQKKILRECNIKALDPHQNIVKVIDTIEGSFTLSQLNGMLPEALFKNEADKSFRDLYFGRLTRVQELEGVLIQMELCGETLRQWLREKHDKLDSALHKKQYAIVKNLIAGLAHLHKNKILHRDLKPENVMFSKTGFVLPVKIGDFGLSRHLHSEQSRTNPLTSRTGTLDYRASECLDNDYSFPADLYSLGLMIWEVAQLIKSNDRSKMFDKLVNDKEVSLIELHPQIKGLRELIIALTKKSASDRFQQLEQVQKVFAQKELCDLKEGHHLTARNGEELRKLLKGATPGSKIFLIEAEYDGNFVVEGESITIVGKGEKTVFTNSGSNSFVVKGMGHRILNLKISKSGEHAGFNCLRVEGDMNSFSDLILIGGAYSVKIKGNDNKLDKIQVSVAIKGIHITGSRNTIDDICLTGDTTLFDISVPETTDFFKNLVATFSNIRSNRDCILSEGMYNKFSRVTFQGDFTLGIIFILMRANFNSIENCTNDSFSRLILNIESDNVAASNINCHGINISGNNISLTKATNLERITICSKCGGVELTNCSAMVLAATKNVLLRNSVFGRLERPTI